MTNVIKKTFKKELGVDSGSLYVMPLSYARKFGYSQSGFDMSFMGSVPLKGVVKYKVSIKETWNGPIEIEGEFKDCGGAIIVSDPCYVLTETDKFWAENDWQSNGKDGCTRQIRTGGDGGFKTTIKLEWDE